MKKLLTVLLLAAAGCASPRDGYTRSAYRPEAVEPSKKDDVRIAGIRFMPEIVADLLGNADREISEEELAGLEKIAYREPLYFAAEVALPKEVQLDSEKYTLKENSTRFNLEALAKLLGPEQTWKKVNSPYELAGKDANYLVFELQKAHPVLRCPTGEHVLDEEDAYVITSIKLATKNGTAHLTVYNDEGSGIRTEPDYEPIKDILAKHYAESHREAAYQHTGYTSRFHTPDLFRFNRFNHFNRLPRCDPKVKDHCQIRHK